LGAVESEAIAQALELRAEALLLDDRKARVEAQKRGLIT
jgi:predicted nucleic acid-binding protein